MTDIVHIGDATLYHADCRDVLPTLPKFDLLLTDPPYGIGVNKMQLGNGKRKLFRGDLDWDEAPPDAETISALMAACAQSIVWGGNYFALPASRCWLVWDKCTGANSFADAELAWTDIDSCVRLIKHAWVGANARDRDQERVHPTQKPLAVMAWCLTHAPAAKSVFDPYMGSGTTGVACAQSGRSFTGIERERKYFDIAVQRIERAYAQGKLFEPTQPKPEQQEIAA